MNNYQAVFLMNSIAKESVWAKNNAQWVWFVCQETPETSIGLDRLCTAGIVSVFIINWVQHWGNCFYGIKWVISNVIPYFWLFLRRWWGGGGSKPGVLCYHFYPQFIILWEKACRCHNTLTPEIHSYELALLCLSWNVAASTQRISELVGFELGFYSKTAIITR